MSLQEHAWKHKCSPGRKVKHTELLPMNDSHSSQPAPGDDGARELSSLDPVSAGQARAERAQFQQQQTKRRSLVPRAALLGVLTGLLAVAFRVALEWLDGARSALFAGWHGLGFAGLPLCILWSALLAGAGVWLVKRFAPEASGSGVPHLKGVLLGLQTMRATRILLVKFGGGLLALGSGLLMGREGPTLQMGGAMGDLVGRFLGAGESNRRILIAAGAAAGLSAAFNAPLAGLIFVLEEVQGDFEPAMFAAALVASLVADVVGRVLVGQESAFRVAVDNANLGALPAYLVLGLSCGVLGVAFNRALMWGSNPDARWQKWPRGVWGVAVGALVGGVGFFAPQLLGAGHSLTEATFAQASAPDLWASAKSLLWLVPLALVLRFCLTSVSYSTGAAGGFFAPILSMGAQLGLVVALGTHFLAPQLGIHPQNFAVVGMAALFAASVRAPLTSIVLIIEMTNGYGLILPLLTACLAAYGVADALGDLPIYEALLERDLTRLGRAHPAPVEAALAT